MKAGVLIRTEKVLVEIFNRNYINIMEKTSGIILKQIGNPSNPNLDAKTVNKIIKSYENHPRITKINENIKEIIFFGFSIADTKNITLSYLKISRPQESYWPTWHTNKSNYNCCKCN